jgi:hypothetical protein
MSEYQKKAFEEGLSQAGDERLRPGEWVVYPEYEIESWEEQKYIKAPLTAEQLKGVRRYRPLSEPYAGLFLEFADWPEKFYMSLRTPESKNNEKAALAWVRKYGVLGVNPPGVTILDSSTSALHGYLGRPSLGFDAQARQNTGRGGWYEESVVRFTDEALIARMALRLYDAATSPAIPDVSTIAKFMGKRRNELGNELDYPSIQEIHGRTPEAAKDWALDVVERFVQRQVAGRCHPTLFGDPGSYEQGWAFDSLLGALWLQMLWYMTGQTPRCKSCLKVLKGKRRSDSAYCDAQCRSNWNYHHGIGKSSKHERKKGQERGG